MDRWMDEGMMDNSKGHGTRLCVESLRIGERSEAIHTFSRPGKDIHLMERRSAANRSRAISAGDALVKLAHDARQPQIAAKVLQMPRGGVALVDLLVSRNEGFVGGGDGDVNLLEPMVKVGAAFDAESKELFQGATNVDDVFFEALDRDAFDGRSSEVGDGVDDAVDREER